MNLSNLLLIVAFALGCFGIYRSGQSIHIGIFYCLFLGIFLTGVSWWITPIIPNIAVPTKQTIAPQIPTAKEIADEVAKQIQPTPSMIKPATPSPEIKLVFKNSALLTGTRKNKITFELNAFRNYLVGLGFEVPKETPPMGIGKGNGSTSALLSSGDPVLSGDIYIGDKAIDNLSTWRNAYSHYVFEKILCTNIHDTNVYAVRSMCSFILMDYYACSFANKHHSSSNDWVNALWDIRATCSKNFTDRSLFYTCKSIVQDEYANGLQYEDADFTKVLNKYFILHLYRGIWVLDNNFQNKPKIIEILKKYQLITQNE